MNIKIGSLDWTILKAKSHDPVLMVDGVECTGTTWLGRAEIYIDDALEGSRALRTIAHELCHAYIFSTQAIRPETWDEESMCDFIAEYGKEISTVAFNVYQTLFVVDLNLEDLSK